MVIKHPPMTEEPELTELLALCQAELQAVEIWIFGSRARGDHHPDSDWDILVVTRDDAPESILDRERHELAAVDLP